MRDLPLALLVQRSWGGGVVMILHVVVMKPPTSELYKPGTKQTGFSPDQAHFEEEGVALVGIFPHGTLVDWSEYRQQKLPAFFASLHILENDLSIVQLLSSVWWSGFW